MQAALSEKGIDDFLFPVIPDGFRVVESNLYDEPDLRNLEFDTLYEDEENMILFMISRNSSQNALYEKNSDDVSIYEHSGTDHYIFSNIDNITAAWYADSLEYSIATNLSVSALKNLIDSMYEE